MAAMRPSQPPDRLRARSPTRQSRGSDGGGARRRLDGRESAGDRLGPADRRVQGAGRDRLPLERPARLGELRPQVLDDLVGLDARGAHVLVALAPRPPAFLVRRAQRVGRPELRGAGAVEGLARLALGRLDRGQGRLERALRLGQARAGVLDDRSGQTEPLGDRERLAAAGQPDRQAIGRRQRLEVELDRGVARPGRGVRVGLELGVVGRGRHDRAGPDEMVEQRLRQRRALGRVGAGAELVEQDQRVRAGRLDDRGDAAQVARERRERLRHRLLVADVGEDVAPHRQAAARPRPGCAAPTGASG